MLSTPRQVLPQLIDFEALTIRSGSSQQVFGGESFAEQQGNLTAAAKRTKSKREKLSKIVSGRKIVHFVQSRMNSLCILRFAQFWPVSNSNRYASKDSINHPSSSSSPGMFKLQLLHVEEVLPTSELIPKTRSGHRMVADDSGDLYSFGGFNLQVPVDDTELSHGPSDSTQTNCNTLFQELWKFDWRTRRWRKLKTTGDIPDKLVSHCMCYWRRKIIIYGGTGLPYGRKSSNRLTIYHIEQNRWEQIQPLSEPSCNPQELYGQACVCDQERGELYVIGGTDGSKYNLDVHKFNLYNKKWTPLYRSTGYDPGEPGLRYRHEIALHNNKLFIFGGSTNETFYGFEELPVFDLETNAWTYVKTKPHIKQKRKGLYPNRRKCHSLGVIGNDCYIAGGTNGETVCSDIWHINLEELKWTLLVDCIPFPVYFHAAAMSFNSKLTIFGGVEDADGKYRNNKLTTIWLKIPSLKQICLSSVDHYAKHKLLDLGKCKATGLVEALEVAGLVTDDDGSFGQADKFRF